jgi:hypothetical protein
MCSTVVAVRTTLSSDHRSNRVNPKNSRLKNVGAGSADQRPPPNSTASCCSRSRSFLDGLHDELKDAVLRIGGVEETPLLYFEFVRQSRRQDHRDLKSALLHRFKEVCAGFVIFAAVLDSQLVGHDYGEVLRLELLQGVSRTRGRGWRIYWAFMPIVLVTRHLPVGGHKRFALQCGVQFARRNRSYGMGDFGNWLWPARRSAHG